MRTLFLSAVSLAAQTNLAWARSAAPRNAGITSEAFSWGTSDGGNGVGFAGGALLGVTAVGNTLTIQCFHKGCCADTADAVHTLSFELISAD